MPVADFPGRRNWGYDGVLLYAPDSAYGRPDDLKALIDAAHQRGLMVFLDVVYNHFGPEGNYLGRYAPGIFHATRTTPWGSAIDYRVPQVRAFAIENALHWLQRLSLRRAAPRCGACHRRAGRASDAARAEPRGRGVRGRDGRMIHLVLENDDNRASLLDPRDRSAARKISRAVERRLSPRLACAADRRNARLLSRLRDRADTSRALCVRLRLSGRGLAAPQAATRAAKPCAALPPTAFVNFLQNHDQIGNRALGDRLSTQADARRSTRRWRSCCSRRCRRFCSWARNGDRQRPFPFFCDFRGELADAVRKGRREEFEIALCRVWARKFPIRWTRPRSVRPCSIGMRGEAGSGRRRLDLVRESVDDRAAKRSCRGSPTRHSDRGALARRRLDRAVDARRQDCSAPCSPTSRTKRDQRRRTSQTARPIWGDASAPTARLVGVLEHRSA